MTPDLFWIPGPWRGRLAISNRPRGGDWLEDELQAWRRVPLDIVVSLLENEEEQQLDLTEEARLAEANGLRFLSFPIVDRSVPNSVPAAISLIRSLNDALEQGKNVAVHCRQGIGRSAIIAAGVLMAAGAQPKIALETIRAARSLNVPETPEQRQWLER